MSTPWGDIPLCADQLAQLDGVEVYANIALADLTSWKIGGCADVLARPQDIEAAQRLFAFLAAHSWPWTVLGGGTNVLVADAGVRGVVVQLSRLKHMEQTESARYRVGSGVALPCLVRHCCAHGHTGIEALGGIPGSVGGAVVMNAGAGGQEFGAVVTSVRAIVRGKAVELEHAQLEFGYRSSAVGHDMVVLEVSLQLKSDSAATCQERLEHALAHRRQAQHMHLPNAGSVFRNPPSGAAWQLIDACGLRGKHIGGAQIASEHANFIVNSGNATAADVVALIRYVQAEVLRRSGIKLHPEVRCLGMDGI